MEKTLKSTLLHKGRHFNFKALDGLRADYAAILLRYKAAQLGDDVNADYWMATEGNTKKAIFMLIEFADFVEVRNIKAWFHVH